MTEQIPQPSPLPEHWAVAIAQMQDGTKQILIQISGPAGTKVSFLPPDTARQLGQQLAATAQQASTGLIIPTGVALPNGQQP